MIIDYFLPVIFNAFLNHQLSIINYDGLAAEQRQAIG
jgi:hypothetical protein